MKIIKYQKPDLNKIAKQVEKNLKAGGLVVLPSDTAYGLAVDARSQKAVARIYAFKGRRFGKGVSIFLNSLDEAGQYTIYNKHQLTILKTLLPGPFTVVLKSKGKLALNLEPGDGTLGVRVIEHDLIRAVTQSVGFPITATSANLAGKGPHFSVSSFLNTLSVRKKRMIDLVVDAGDLPRRPTSTLVRLVRDEMEILRQGILNPELIFQQEAKGKPATKKFAQKIFQEYLAKDLRQKAVMVILKGGLGAGKTVFAQGIGELFNLRLTSPTFVLMDEHPINIKSKSRKLKTMDTPGVCEGSLPVWGRDLKNIYHLDLYRIEDENELLGLELEKFLKPGNLILIEWEEKLSIFERLKSGKVAFYFVQIEEISKNRRRLSCYKL